MIQSFDYKLYLQILLITFFLLFSCFFSNYASAQQLNPISIAYKVKLASSKLGNATIAQQQITLTANQNGYSGSLTTKAQGLAAILYGSTEEVINCDFNIDQGKVASSQYSGGNINSDNYKVSFDWEARKINFTDGESLDMPQGYMLDTCNFPFAAALLKDSNSLDETLYVLEGKERIIRGYTLKSNTEEQLETVIGTINTIKIVLERELRADRTVSLWLSPQHSYIPLKMEDKRSSRTTTMIVVTIEN